MTKKIERYTRKNKIVVAVLVAALLLSASYLSAFNSNFVKPNSIVTPGWELYNQIAGMQYPAGVKTGTSDFPSGQAFISGPMWKVDEDSQYYGSPTVMIQTSDIRHVDFSGNSIPNTQSAATVQSTVGTHKYNLDYHIYMFDVTIRTIADEHITGSSSALGGYPVFEHETSWGYYSDEGLPFYAKDRANTGHGGIGSQFDGGAYVKFVISPWRGDNTAAPANYTLVNAWAGTMNSYIFNKEQGQVANQWGDLPSPSGDAPMFVKGGLDNGAQVPMFADDGSYGTSAPRTNWDSSVSPDSRISSTVVLYLPVQEQAGAYLTRDVIQGVTAISPCDVYVKYTLRIDVLQAHDFVLHTAVAPPTLAPPGDFYSWVKGFWDGLFNPFGNSSWIVWALVLVAAIAAFYFLVLKKKTTEGTSRTRNKYYGLSIFDWLIVGIFGILTVIPDPTDLLSGGLPLADPLIAIGYYWYRSRKNVAKEAV